MRPSVWYRVSSIVLVLYALGHQLGFRITDPQWAVDSVVGAMKNRHFVVQGLTRSYWDFFSAFGFFATVFILFGAFLAWQLGGLSKEALYELRPVCWGFAVTFAVLTIITWQYIFIIPLVFSAVVTLCLFMAAATIRAI